MLEKYPYIETITLEKMKTMSEEELSFLSDDIRAFLIEELSSVGGHLASNLGVVELTIALFKTFDSPTDSFFWDIGHQSYVHKILTGRASDFDTLRQYNGLSGFMKSAESPHDVWEAGHASTSLSGATGMTIDRAHHNEDSHVISIIGDGALTGGMALEALNHIGDLGLPHIIVLNDNNMSISQNVGALNKHINGLRVNPSYVNAKKNTKYVLSKIMFPGKVLDRSIGWIKEKTKKMLMQGTDINFFGTMGLDYIGPIDGHNIEELSAALEHAKTRKQPVILHVYTTKGKGFTPAESDEKGVWHGIGPYSVEKGEKVRKDNRVLRQWSSVVSETLERFAMHDDTIVAVTPAMIKGSKLVHFAQKYPNRIFDVGIAEEHAMTLIGGMALKRRLKPFLAIYSTFIQRAYDQLIHDVARQKIPVVIGIDRCGFAGGDGETHHGLYDISIMNTIPNMIITMGKDAVETQQLMYSAFYRYNFSGPIAIRYPRGYADLAYVSRFEEIPFGTWEKIQYNKKAKIVILTFGPQLKVAQEVASYFESKNISIDIINARFIKPLDSNMLEEIAKQYTNVVTIEEGARMGGFGANILNFFHHHELFSVRTHIFAIDDIFIEQGDNRILQKEAGIDAATIIQKLEERLK